MNQAVNEANVWTDKVISEFERPRSHSYPHCNGFADGGDSVVLAQTDPAKGASLWKCDLRTVPRSDPPVRRNDLVG